MTFVPNPRYLHEGMFNSTDETLYTLHNWIELSASMLRLGYQRLMRRLINSTIDARGYVQIDNSGSYGLGDPYTVKVNYTSDGPAYMMSVFHQLHCLVGAFIRLRNHFSLPAQTREKHTHSSLYSRTSCNITKPGMLASI